MIKEIKSIKNLGIFKDFVWHDSSIENEKMEDFQKYNLIYGKNGTGKTTISRIFSSLENHELTTYYEKPDFNILTENGLIKSENIEASNLEVRVFNKDFIKENIDISNNKTNPIIMIGVDNIKLNNDLRVLKDKFEELKKDNLKYNPIFRDYQKDIELKKSNIAKSIKESWGRYTNFPRYKNYNKSYFESFNINNAVKISDVNEKEKHESFLRQSDSFKKINKLSNINIIDKKIFEETKDILALEIKANSIELFEKNPDIEHWVKNGINIHDNHDVGNCLYCGNKISDGRMKELNEHFNDEYGKINEQIKLLDREIDQEEIKISNFIFNYENCLGTYEIGFKGFEANLIKLNKKYSDWLKKIKSELSNKKQSIYNKITLISDYLQFEEDYEEIIKQINYLVNKNNTDIDNLEAKLLQTAKKLENHYIAEGIENEKYLEKIEKRNQINILIGKNNENMDEYDNKINEIEKQMSDFGQAINKVNEYLSNFLGRKEIYLELNSDGKSYSLVRNGREATNLSEGEQTAIAFSYFLVKTEEKSFNKANGIIYIDDPISSLDSINLYHSFSFIKEHFEDKCKQLFISTHNFDFFELLKSWLQGKQNVSYYTLECVTNGTERVSCLKEMEKVLKDYKGEYHYLFFRLESFLDEKNENDIYVIGNIARRFFEGYVNFKVPASISTDLKSRIEKLIEGENINKTDVNLVYKLINDYSHFNNIEKIGVHNLPDEIEKMINCLFKIVEITDKKHFDLLSKASLEDG